VGNLLTDSLISLLGIARERFSASRPEHSSGNLLRIGFGITASAAILAW
jgi:hypothetical protein